MNQSDLTIQPINHADVSAMGEQIIELNQPVKIEVVFKILYFWKRKRTFVIIPTVS